MAKSKDKGWGAVRQAAASLSERDNATRDRADQQREGSSTLPLEKIKPRPNEQTRPASPRHVLDVAESIQAISLVEPLVVDRKGRLLAGLHRWSALSLLMAPGKAERIDIFQSILEAYKPGSKPSTRDIERLEKLDRGAASALHEIPVYVKDLDAIKDPQAALEVEIAENEIRRDYTKDEVQVIADRLKKAGYHSKAGRPKEGDKSLMPALEDIVGKSRTTLWRLLKAPAKTELIVSDETINSAERLAHDQLKQALRRYLDNTNKSTTESVVALRDAVKALQKQVKATKV